MVQRNLFITIMTILNLALQIVIPQGGMLPSADQTVDITIDDAS